MQRFSHKPPKTQKHHRHLPLLGSQRVPVLHAHFLHEVPRGQHPHQRARDRAVRPCGYLWDEADAVPKEHKAHPPDGVLDRVDLGSLVPVYRHVLPVPVPCEHLRDVIRGDSCF